MLPEYSVDGFDNCIEDDDDDDDEDYVDDGVFDSRLVCSVIVVALVDSVVIKALYSQSRDMGSTCSHCAVIRLMTV